MFLKNDTGTTLLINHISHWLFISSFLVNSFPISVKISLFYINFLNQYKRYHYLCISQ
ncbi:hypothetical protein XBP1_2720017 [Xenorhabdus bovienii str. puntauvense]|uniref:Uncharacterized protein n=4 Tax=Xenorhabdus bovienii TaxID=40576 RepID=A0A0B6XA27_XENBV|nr:hypothetical protein XBFFR1_2300011 [Xenorhabdus bovienii str. feltiae France]CDG93678.1 hypothetical protein XBFFL1_2660003 [Xenorhabdus bovienii str. feltiae Florida]CDG97667.1 hypothetical protein XBP1_2720017 [Xenorhabdus bovienii str. puntauvense]CDH02007.1 hypothetical protein XBFM1_2420027 [Xenorhabdus bovienii str. feltiae Moldova]CDH23025.1 hypothetical protein XBKB1_1440003 [Xenorhabdus bovienii str. kraussei Becker Underwood]CDM89578.1 protein of unknown function [Xenorhabdus bov